MKYKAPLNPSAVNSNDLFLIIQEDNNEIIESAGTVEKACRAVNVLNGHEKQNGRTTTYKWVIKEN